MTNEKGGTSTSLEDFLIRATPNAGGVIEEALPLRYSGSVELMYKQVVVFQLAKYAEPQVQSISHF